MNAKIWPKTLQKPLILKTRYRIYPEEQGSMKPMRSTPSGTGICPCMASGPWKLAGKAGGPVGLPACLAKLEAAQGQGMSRVCWCSWL